MSKGLKMRELENLKKLLLLPDSFQMRSDITFPHVGYVHCILTQFLKFLPPFLVLQPILNYFTILESLEKFLFKKLID
jgi:hypothetical protein